MDKFSRQRRNLMIMSIVVVVQDLAGLRYEEVSVLGNKAIIENPEMVKILLLFFLGYWFFRYIQLFNEIGQKGISTTFKSLFKNSVKQTGWYKNLCKTNSDSETINGDGKTTAKLRDREVSSNSLLSHDIKFIYSDFMTEHNHTEIHELPLRATLWSGFLAFLKLIFMNYRFTEYILPFILFFAAVCSWTLSNRSLLFS